MVIPNPLVPGLPDVLVAILAFVLFAAWFAAFVTLWQARARMSPGALMVWTAIVVALNWLGGLAWLLNWATTKSLRSREFSPAPVPPLT